MHQPETAYHGQAEMAYQGQAGQPTQPSAQGEVTCLGHTLGNMGVRLLREVYNVRIPVIGRTF